MGWTQDFREDRVADIDSEAFPRRWDGIDRQNDTIGRWGREAREGKIGCECGNSTCRSCYPEKGENRTCERCGTSRAQGRYYIVGRDGERDDVCIPCRKDEDPKRRKREHGKKVT